MKADTLPKNALNPADDFNPKGLLLAAYAVLVTLSVFLLLRNWVYDDPFITYRYAQNLANGLGIVYNPGQAVLSTTTPLFTLILAASALLGADLPHTATLIGAASLAAGAILLWDLARSWNSPIVGWTALLLYPTCSLILPTISSETPLYLALCIGAFTGYARKSYLLAGLLAGLATVARPDGILVAAVLGGHFLLTGGFYPPGGLARRPFPWAGLAIFLVITGGWYLYAWGFFGSPLPATLVAKQHQASMTISRSFTTGFLDILKSYFRPNALNSPNALYSQWVYWLQAVLAVIGIGWLTSVAIRRQRERAWMLFILWTVLYFSAYALLGVSSYFWYYAPLAPGLLVLIGLGVTALSSIPLAKRHRQAAQIAVVVLLIGLATNQVASLVRMSARVDARYPVYRAIGKWIETNTPPEARVGVIELGMIGYYTQRSMIDFAGLLFPDLAQQITPDTGFDDAALWAVQHYPIDIIVIPKNQFPRLESQHLNLHCQPVKTFSGAEFGTSLGPQVIYACQ